MAHAFHEPLRAQESSLLLLRQRLGHRHLRHSRLVQPVVLKRNAKRGLHATHDYTYMAEDFNRLYTPEHFYGNLLACTGNGAC